MPTQHRAIQSRQALIRSAAQTFIEKGVPASGMVEISRRARLSKGALYFHFTSKEDLTLAVRDEAFATLRELETALTLSRLPVRQAVRDFAVALLKGVDSDVVLRAGLRLPAGSDARLGDCGLHQRWYTLFLDKARADRAEGRLRADDDARRTARLLTSIVLGLLHLGHEDRMWWDRDVVTDIWSALTSGPAAGPAALVTSALAQAGAPDPAPAG